jgi:outer membrane protein insertion porin family
MVFSKPLLGPLDRVIDTMVYQLDQNYTVHRAYQEILRGACINYQIHGALGVHRWSYQAEWREIGGIPEQASLDIRHEAGHSLKSSVKYVFALHRLDDLILPTRGYRLKLSTVS